MTRPLARRHSTRPATLRACGLAVCLALSAWSSVCPAGEASVGRWLNAIQGERPAGEENPAPELDEHGPIFGAPLFGRRSTDAGFSYARPAAYEQAAPGPDGMPYAAPTETLPTPMYGFGGPGDLSLDEREAAPGAGGDCGHTFCLCPCREFFARWFSHADANDPGRHIGKGEPLEGTSWLNRPFHVDFFLGLLEGDTLISGRLYQKENSFGGFRVGWDFDHYWGCEGRLGLSHLGLEDATDKQVFPDVDLVYWDANLLYYPWGDARWRPYASLGLGIADYRFNDELQIRHNEVLLQIPIGIGLKYQYRHWLALRMDLQDNLAVAGSGLATQNNVSLTFGAEVHFGGFRHAYGPWNPTIHFW